MDPSPRSTAAHYRWPVTIISLALIGLAGFLFTVRSCTPAPFSNEALSQQFTAAIPEIHSTGGGNLELATADALETFSRSDSRFTGWGWLFMGTTVTEIKAPVTYRYYLRLEDKWKLQVSNQTCVVVAPRIRPSLPPAIHTDKMEKKVTSGWARFDEQDQLTALEKSMTPTLEKTASDPRHINLVRDECRKTVAEFVRSFLLKEDQWRTDRLHTIKVLFADEESSMSERIAPTLEFPRP